MNENILKNLSLKNQYDEQWTFQKHKNRFTVIFAYPKALTSGCTEQALNYQANLEKFKTLHTDVVGLSKDPVKKLAEFSEKKELTYTLLSDEALEYIHFK